MKVLHFYVHNFFSRPDIEKSIFKIVVKFPKLTLEGNYFVDAKLLLVPIKGEGTFSAEVSKYFVFCFFFFEDI